jgi:Heparinase II/III-like protein/Heparinase II/III N-terminus
MGPVEIVGRSRQEIAKWMDRRPSVRHFQGRRLGRVLPPLPSPAFFPGALDDHTVAVLDRRFPEARERLVEAAEQPLLGRFDLLGYRALAFGKPLDWHADPVAGRRAPLRPASTIDPLDGEAIGDSKVIWELSRHQWLVRLGQAYRLTRDERFASAFSDHVTSWMEANPWKLGVNWSSSVEAAFRIISWSWALHLFHGSPALGPGLTGRILASIEGHAGHVERYLSYYFSPNTHLTGEALGLFYAGTLFPALRRARRWRDLGHRILEAESQAQILPDGIYFEQSTCYQRYTADIYLHYLILAERSGAIVSSRARDRVTALLDALLVLLRPDRSMPSIGDADGGWLLPLDVRGPDDAREVFSTAAVVFSRPDYAWAAGGLQPDTVWLLGRAATDRYDALSPAPPPGPPSRILREGGYAVLRTTWREDADQVVLDAGPLGCPYSSGHGHADLLSIQCTFQGRPYVVDPGTFRYTTDQGWRPYFRSTAAHSTVEVDGAGQAVPLGPFAWQGRPRARLLRFERTATLDFAEAEHHAYGHLAGSIVHRRAVILAKRGYCVVVDNLAGTGEHRIDLRFQLAPAPVAVEPDQWVRVGGPDGGGLLIRAFSTVSLKLTVAEGEVEPRQGWISPAYGVKRPAPALVYTTVSALPLRVVTLLSPAAQLPMPPRVSAIVESGVLSGLSLEDVREDLRLDPPELSRRLG